MSRPDAEDAPPPCGILLLDKPCGLSSNAALQRVRGLLGRPRAGHVGSLDPLASGMLPICIGEATKIAGDVLAARKRYRFSVALGSATATGDAEGAVTATAAVPELDRARIEEVLAGFVGVREQVPPMYSALKRDGQPLYRLARAGITVPRAPRTIELLELSLLDCARVSLEIEALCSSGTYIRVLAEELAVALGTVGYVSALRRLWVEPFASQPMTTLEALTALRAHGEWPALLEADLALAHLPSVHLDGQATARLRHGQAVPAASAAPAPRIRLYDAAGAFIGIGAAEEAGTVRPRRLFAVAGGS